MPSSYLRRPLFLALAAYMIGIASWRAVGGFKPASAGPDPIPLPALVEMEGIAASALGETAFGEKFELRAQKLEGASWRARVLVRLPLLPISRWPKPGESFRLSGWLSRPQGAENSGGFDERDFLAKQGVGWVLKADEWTKEPDAMAWRWRLYSLAQAARYRLEDCFERELGPDDGRLMAGFVLGYKGRIDPALNRQIQDAGVMHLIVPSGTKMAVVLGWLWALGGLLTLGVAWRFWISAVGGGFYLLMVGAEPPYMRAYLAALALIAGLWAGRESGAFQAMTLSAWAILLFDPRALFSPGFQMTYLAAAGLLIGLPWIKETVPKTWSKMARAIWAGLAATVLVQALLWPVFGAIFGRAALLGAVSNLILVPLSAVLMALGFAFWTTSRLNAPLSLGIAAAIKVLLIFFRWVCAVASSLPFAAMSLKPMTAAGAIVYYLTLAGLLILPGLGLSSMWYNFFSSRPTRNQLR